MSPGLTLNGFVEIVYIFIKPLLLVFASRVAGKFRAIKIGLRSNASDAPDDLAQGLARIGLVNAGRTKFPFKTDKFCLLPEGDLHVGLREDGDHISGHQREILSNVSVDGFAQVERQQMKSKIGRIEPLDNGVLPVDFSRGTFDLVLEFFLFDSLQFGAPHTIRCRQRRAGIACSSCLAALERPGAGKSVRRLIRIHVRVGCS